MTTRRSALQALAATAALPLVLGAARPARAQTIAQLTIVVGFPPGGATDGVARLAAEGLRGKYADVVVVENRAGGAGRLGAMHVKEGPADGSMLLFTPAFPLAIFPHIYPDLPYDAFADFIPVATTSKGNLALSVGPAMPAEVKTLQDFVAWCKANPERANFGAPTGGGQHFAGATLAREAGIPLQVVGYKGGAPATVDLLGGHIASSINPLSEVVQFARDGKLRILATTGDERSSFLPEVPTMKEFGYNVVFQDWSGFLAPAGTPPEVVARANAAINDFVRSEKGAAGLKAFVTEADVHTPESFAALYKATWERYRDVVRETGFKAEA